MTRLMTRLKLAMLASLVAVTSAHGQATFGVGAGGAFPVGNSANQYSAGYNILAFLGLNVPTLPIGVRFDGQFDRWQYKNNGPNTNLWHGTANVVFQEPLSIVTPYVIGGVGYYSTDLQGHTYPNGSVVVATSANSLGVNGGVGIKAALHWGLGVFLEARYHYVFSHFPDTQLIPITLGVTF
jgi:hypothetical protein